MTGAAVQRVAVVGRDASAWITALAIRRAFAASRVQVEVVELPTLVRPVDVYAAVPALGGLHTLLGLDETELLGACAGVPIAGQRFSDWGRSAPPFLHGYDTVGEPSGDLGFIHYWVKARSKGLQVAFEDFSLAASAAKQARVPAELGGDATLSASRGYHLHAASYVALVRKHALRSGVSRRSAVGVQVERKGDMVAAVVIDGGARIEADLFIDASGSEAVLIGGAPGAETESWSQWLPGNRILAASAPRLASLPSFSQISAFRAGWIGLYPLQDRTPVTAVWNADDVSEDSLLDDLPLLSGMAITGDAFVTAFEPGMRRRPWIGNVVAIGDAAVSLEPLDGVQLHLTHIGVSQLITLFPVEAGSFPEATVYNRGMGSHAENVRDFQIAHYRLNRRFDEPVWDRARSAAGPAGLNAKLSVFAGRGEILLYDDESFEEQNWTAVFVGHGLVPGDYDHRIDRVPEQEHMARIQQRLRAVAGQVHAMPSVEAYLQQGPAQAKAAR